MGNLAEILANLYAGLKISLDYYTYTTTNPFVFTAAGTATALFSIEANSDFIWLSSAYWVNVANAAQTDATRNLFNGTVLLTDAGSGLQLMNAAVPVNSMFGTGEFPFILPQGKVLAAKSALQIQVTQLEATTQNLFLAFQGVKVFVKG